MLHAPGYAVDKHVHGAGGPEDTDAHKHCHQIGNDAHGCGEAVLGTIDESVIYIDSLGESCYDEGHDDAEEDEVAGQVGHCGHGVFVHLPETPDDNAYERHQGEQRNEQHRVKKIDVLPKAGDDDSGQGGHGGGQENGDEYVGGYSGAHGGTDAQDGSGNDGESGGVEHQEHYHGVGGGVFLLVELLHLLHGLEPCGGGSVVEPEHVARYVHEDTPHDRMVLGQLGEELGEDGAQQPREEVYGAGAFANLHNAEPQCQYTGEADGYLKSVF